MMPGIFPPTANEDAAPLIGRRTAVSALAAGSLAGFTTPFGSRVTLASTKRTLKVMSNANVAGIHVPGNVACREILQQIGDYGSIELSRLEKQSAITQILVGGGPDIVDADTPSICAAVAAGANLKIVGQFYASVDLVFTADADKVTKLEDLTKPDVVVGINTPGDTVHAVLLGVLMKHGIDTSKVNVVALGGSSARMRALLSHRVHLVPIHADQAGSIAREGNYKVLIQPWKEYDFWSNEVWAVNGRWLEDTANQRVVVDMMEAQLRANRSAGTDFGWFAGMFRKYSNDRDAAHWPDERIHGEWTLLAQEVKAWPEPMPLDLAAFNTLIPIYEKAGIVSPGASFDKIIEPRFLAEAQKRLG
jgi:NitT/TauT family transport system substrate-binding protein